VEPEGLRDRPDVLDVEDQRRLLARLETIPPESWERVHFRGNVALRRKISFGVNDQPDSRALRPAPGALVLLSGPARAQWTRTLV